MAAPPPDTLIAALLAAILGIVAPATGVVVTAMKPGSATTCSPAARNLVAPTTSAASGAGWQELAAQLSGDLAGSDDPEAQKLAQAIGDTGTPGTTGAPTTRTRTTTAPRSPSRTATSGPCPAPSDRSSPATTTATRAPAARTSRTSSPPPSSRSADQRWEQLAGQLAAALAGATDPRAADLQEALDRAGFPAARPSATSSRPTPSRARAPRTTAVPEPDDPGGGG